DDELARMLAGAVAAVPAQGLLAREPLDPRVPLGDGPPLGLAVHQVVLFPAVAVPADVVPLRGDRVGHGGIALERHGTGEERAPDAVLREDAEEAPDARTAAVLEHRFIGQV